MTWVGAGMTQTVRRNDADREIYGLGAIHTSEQGGIYANESNGTDTYQRGICIERLTLIPMDS